MGLVSQQPITRAQQLMEASLIRDPSCAGMWALIHFFLS